MILLSVLDLRRGRGRPKKSLAEVIRHDITQLQITENMTLDRRAWRSRIKVVGLMVVGALISLVMEPVAFAGGIFAGILRLDLNEDPLKEWVARTVEASGEAAEETEASDDQTDDTPQPIEIE